VETTSCSPHHAGVASDDGAVEWHLAGASRSSASFRRRSTVVRDTPRAAAAPDSVFSRWIAST
jgi:hypothetical protein